VLHSLIFDFLNHRTGRLDPSYEALARKAGVCVRRHDAALPRLCGWGNAASGVIGKANPRAVASFARGHEQETKSRLRGRAGRATLSDQSLTGG
jgi:hypothetical protein